MVRQVGPAQGSSAEEHDLVDADRGDRRESVRDEVVAPHLDFRDPERRSHRGEFGGVENPWDRPCHGTSSKR